MDEWTPGWKVLRQAMRTSVYAPLGVGRAYPEGAVVRPRAMCGWLTFFPRWADAMAWLCAEGRACNEGLCIVPVAAVAVVPAGKEWAVWAPDGRGVRMEDLPTGSGCAMALCALPAVGRLGRLGVEWEETINA